MLKTSGRQIGWMMGVSIGMHTEERAQAVAAPHFGRHYVAPARRAENTIGSPAAD